MLWPSLSPFFGVSAYQLQPGRAAVLPLRGDVRVGQRPVLELARVLELEAQRLRVVTLEEGDKERERQKIVRSKLEKLDVVMRRQGFALFIAKLLPGAAFGLGQVQDDVSSLGLPPCDGAARIFAVALNQNGIAVDGEEELIEEILAHASAPFGYQVIYASIVWKRSSEST